MSKKAERIELELAETNIIMKIPENAVSLEVTAKMIDENGELISVGKTMNVQDIFQARKDFLDNIIDGDDYDAKYVLTDKGREWLDSLLGG